MPKGLDYLINIKDGNLGGAKKAKDQVKDLDNAIGGVGKSANNIGSLIGKVGGLIAGAFAVNQVFAFATASKNAFTATEVAAGQVNQAIITTGSAAGRSLADLKAQANDLENTTLFGDEQTLAAQSLLLTFTNVKGAIFDSAIPAIQDMAQRMAGDGPADLKGASIQVGKALNDPIAGITALSRVGVSFTAAQKAQIEQMVKTGNTAGAQALILKELNTEFGGSAKAARDAVGPSADLSQATGDLQKNVGSLISDGLTVLVPKMVSLTNVLSSGVTWFKQNYDTISTVTQVVIAGAAAYGLYQGYLLATQAPLAIITAGQWLLNAAMTANPIGIIVAGVGLLIGGLVVAYNKSETFRAGLNGIMSVAQLLGGIFLGLGKTIIGALTLDKGMFLEGAKAYASGIQEIASGGIGKAFNKGFDNSIAESKKAAAANDKGSTLNSLVPKAGGATGAMLPGASSPGGSASAAAATSVSSSRQVRNVSVTINKLVESLTVNTTNLQGTSGADLKNMITELMVSAVHDSELALS